MIIYVKRIKNVGRNGEYPAIRNIQTTRIYVDVNQGKGIPCWCTWVNDEPECEIKHDIHLELVKE